MWTEGRNKVLRASELYFRCSLKLRLRAWNNATSGMSQMCNEREDCDHGVTGYISRIFQAYQLVPPLNSVQNTHHTLKNNRNITEVFISKWLMNSLYIKSPISVTSFQNFVNMKKVLILDHKHHRHWQKRPLWGT
jgi:hypothetical protein